MVASSGLRREEQGDGGSKMEYGWTVMISVEVVLCSLSCSFELNASVAGGVPRASAFGEVSAAKLNSVSAAAEVISAAAAERKVTASAASFLSDGV